TIAKGADVPPAIGTVEPPPPPHKLTDVLVLPFAAPGEAKADLDGTTLTWTLRDAPKEKLQSWQIQKPAKPAGFVIKRQLEGNAVEVLATVGPEIRSYSDLSALPRRAYRYWVFVTGEETKRSSYPP